MCCLGVVSAGTLEWPANLVSLGSSKSSLASVPLPVNEESIELATEQSSLSAEEQQQQQQSTEELEEELQSESAGSASSERLIDARRLVSPVPVSVPLPLLLASRSGLRTVLTVQEPTLARVGSVVEHVPTAVSHQSQTVVHDHRRLVTPIVAPAVRTTQVVRQQQQPLIWTVASDPRLVLLRN